MDMPFLLYPDRQTPPEGEKGMKHNHASDIPNADGIDDRTSPASIRSEHTDTIQGRNASIGGLQQIETCCLDESPATTCNNRSF